MTVETMVSKLEQVNLYIAECKKEIAALGTKLANTQDQLDKQIISSRIKNRKAELEMLESKKEEICVQAPEEGIVFSKVESDSMKYSFIDKEVQIRDYKGTYGTLYSINTSTKIASVEINGELSKYTFDDFKIFI